MKSNLQELEELTNVLSGLQDQYSYFWEHSQDFLAIFTPEGLFIDVNPMWTKVLGWKYHDVYNKSFFDFIHPDDIESTLGCFEDSSVKTFKNRCLKKHGGYAELEWSVSQTVTNGYVCVIARYIGDDQCPTKKNDK